MCADSFFCLHFAPKERERYSCPHKAFIYHVHGFEAPVGPVKVGLNILQLPTLNKINGLDNFMFPFPV